MKRILCVIPLLAVFVVPVMSQPSNTGIDAERDCGAYCLGIVLGLLGEEVPEWDRLREEAQVDEHGITDLATLARAAQARSISVRQVWLGDTPPRGILLVPAKVRQPKDFIYHFIVIDARDADNLIAYTPPTWVNTTTWSRVREQVDTPVLVLSKAAQWPRTLFLSALIVGGLGLFVALLKRSRRAWLAVLGATIIGTTVGCATEPTPGGGRIAVYPGDSIDLGLVPAGSVDADVTLYNDTKSPVTFKGATVSCSCAVTQLEPGTTIEPGARLDTRVKISIEPGQRRSVFAVFRFDGAPNATVHFLVHGGDYPGVVRDTHVVDLGTLRPGRPHHFHLAFSVGREFAGATKTNGDRPLAVTWRLSNAMPIRFVRDGPQPLVVHDTPIEVWADATIEPSVPGPGQTIVTANVNGHDVGFFVHWVVEYPVPVRPPIVELERRGEQLVGSVVVPDDWQIASRDDGISVSETVGDGGRVFRVRTTSGSDGIGGAVVDLVRVTPSKVESYPVHVVVSDVTGAATTGDILDPDHVKHVLLAQIRKQHRSGATFRYATSIAMSGDVPQQYRMDWLVHGHPARGSVRCRRLDSAGRIEHQRVLHDGRDYYVEKPAESPWAARITHRKAYDGLDRWGPIQSFSCPVGQLRWERVLLQYGVLHAAVGPNDTLVVICTFLRDLEDTVAGGGIVSGKLGWRFTLDRSFGAYVLRKIETLATASLYQPAGAPTYIPNRALLNSEGGTLLDRLAFGVTEVVAFDELRRVGALTLPMRVRGRSKKRTWEGTVESIEELRSVPESAFAALPPTSFGERGHLVDEVQNTIQYFGLQVGDPQVALSDMIDRGKGLGSAVHGQGPNRGTLAGFAVAVLAILVGLRLMLRR